MIDKYDVANAFDDRHKIFNALCDAFEASGGSGHDLGVVGAVAIIQAWEKIRTESAVKDLASLTWPDDWN